MSDMDVLRRCTEQYNKIYARMQDIQSAAEKEGEWSEEQRTNWDAANQEITGLEAEIERIQRSIELGKRQADLDSVDYDQVIRTGNADVETAEQRAERDKKYSDAFGSYLRFGMDRLNIEQRQLLMSHLSNDPEVRAQATSPGSAGGYLIPPGYRQVMVEAMKAYGGLINHANVITTATGQPLQWPTNDDTGNTGAILTENSQITELAVTLGTRSIGAYMYTSRLVLVSLQLLQDSVFNLDQWLPRKLGERIGRIVATHLVSGTGSGQPEGVATNATVAVTGTGTTAISYDNIIDLEHSVDPAYRGSGNCRFIFNDSTLAVLRKLKDTQNRPLWLPVPVPGMPPTINGVPYSIDQGMASAGASAKSILFGDFRAGYIVRQVLDLQMVRLAERYADYLQVGFFGFMRLDAKPDDSNAVRAFQHAAS